MPKFSSGFIFLLLLIVFCACRNNKPETKNYFDSLVSGNINYLVRQKALLRKHSVIGQKQDTITFEPDSTKWSNELDVFRQLSAFQRPAYRDDYVLTDGTKDSQSNLHVREFRASKPIPIPFIRFYYYQHLKNLKRIEAQYKENNTLYSTTRNLIMEFDERESKSILSHYTVDGLQQMILSDSVNYHIAGTVSFLEQK
jgi:hypothetical protein